jgi:AraC-like DNA-binding protein
MTASADHLTEMLRGLRLDGVDYSRCQLAAPWGVVFPPTHEAYFHFISRGGCWLKTPAGEWLELADGDAVLLPRGGGHVLASSPEVVASPPCNCRVLEAYGNVFDVEGGGTGAHMLLFTGRMTFNVDLDHPLLRLMPDLMRMSDFIADEPGLPHLLEAMGREVMMDRVGAGGILARLADVLAAAIIRAWVERGCGFASVVGETPARYVAQVRLHQARQWLARDKLRIAVVAQRLGYESEASFSRAFKRITGVAPSQVRATGEAPPAAMFTPAVEAAE